MTFKTLAYIHNLLVNEVDKANLKEKWTRDTFFTAEDNFENGLIPKSELDSAQDVYNMAKEERRNATFALEEFESKAWQ